MSEKRVKYLDKEDIESLGFKVRIVDLGEDTNEYPDILWNGASCGYFMKDKDKNIELFGIYFKIKNKSELKVLMKQLGIE
jgi:hypothetical protein